MEKLNLYEKLPSGEYVLFDVEKHFPFSKIFADSESFDPYTLKSAASKVFRLAWQDSCTWFKEQFYK